MKRILFIALVVGLVPSFTFAAPPEGPPVTVPFELLASKHMAVQIKVNGKGPYRVIFDTGAPMTVLSSKLARGAGLFRDNPPQTVPLFGTVAQVRLKKLEVGTAKAEDVPAIVMDHPTVKAMADVLGPLEGIVGFPFFARYRMTLDYQAKTLTLVENGYDPPDAMQALTYTILGLLSDAPPRRVLAPAAQWGLVVKKPSGDREPGVVVKEVLPGSPAARAGLRTGDRLLTLDDRWTDTVEETYVAAGQVKPGTEAKVVVRRDGQEVEVLVKPTPGL